MADNGVIQAIMRAATAQSQPIDPATIQALEAVKILSAPAKLSNPSHAIQLPATVKSVDDGVITLVSRLGNIQIETSTQLRAGQAIILSVTADGKLAEALAPKRNTGQAQVASPLPPLTATDPSAVARPSAAPANNIAGGVRSSLPGIVLSPVRSFQLPAGQIAGLLQSSLPFPPASTQQIFQPKQTILPADQMIGSGAKTIQSMIAGLPSSGIASPGQGTGKITKNPMTVPSQIWLASPSNNPVGQVIRQLSDPT